MLRCTHPSYRRRNLFEAAIYTKPGASGTHEPPSGGPHIGGAPATPIAALSGSTHKAPGSAGGYLLCVNSFVSRFKLTARPQAPTHRTSVEHDAEVLTRGEPSRAKYRLYVPSDIHSFNNTPHDSEIHW